ncbi:peptidase domain-containing ABC transporter [uncultured Algibacter sp.]|uniref:peptidase domain-containing ABC transporter n=1 Tax=uncultured Algibacter sp. TaxID=298659 RepID=UPI003216E0F7
MLRLFKKKHPFFRQHDQMDCGPTCLKIISQFHGKYYTIDTLKNYCNINKLGTSLYGLNDASEKIGLHSLPVSLPFNELRDDVPLPCIAHWKENHFIVIYDINKKKVICGDPAFGIINYSHEEFKRGWLSKNTKSGNLLLLEPSPEFYKKEQDPVENYNLKIFLLHFKPHKKGLYQLLLGLIIGSILQLFLPFLTQSVIDYGINYENLNFIYLILIGQLILFFSLTTVQILRSWLLLHITSRINIRLISSFLRKLMRLPISFFDTKNTGDIMQRIADHMRIEEFLSSTTLNTLFSLVNIIIFGIVLAYYNITILLVFTVGSVIYIWWSILFLKTRAELDYREFRESADKHNTLYQLIYGMQEIKLNGSGRRRRWEWENVQIRLFKTSIKGLSLSQKQTSGAFFINEFKNIIITFISAKAVISGSLSLGMMLAIQYIIGQLNLPLNDFISFLQTGQDAKISLERLDEIHKIPDEIINLNLIEEIEDNVTLDIEIKKLSFSYNSYNNVLENINLHIPKNKITAIVGTSGSGKTTLLKLLLKFYKIESGNIYINDKNINSINEKSWREKCGVVMQDGYIFNDTILRNITESDSDTPLDKERLKKAINIANLKEVIDKLPSSINTKIGESGIGLSGGEKQRILIARAIYKNPRYLMFDEATSALDSNNEKNIMEKLNNFFQGRTVIIIAHRLSTVKNADQIIVMEKGKLIEKGNHKALTSKKGAYYDLVKNQLELGA